MARIRTESIRETGHNSGYFGKGLIFCEGSTEYNYFNEFNMIFLDKLSKYTNVELELENTEGNALTVFNYAEQFLSKDQNKKSTKIMRSI